MILIHVKVFFMRNTSQFLQNEYNKYIYEFVVI